VAVRLRTEEDLGQMPLADLEARMLEEIAAHA
jgi:hypothetical protein